MLSVVKGGRAVAFNSFLRQHDLVQVRWVYLSLHTGTPRVISK